jgi:multimeric flavodoxin WrbA
MRITAINGSPKGEKSNSREIISILQSLLGESVPIRVVSQISQYRKPDDADLRAMAESDVLFIASSLYVDGLPASLMALLDRYASYLAGAGASSRVSRQRVFGAVNCGFFEGAQNASALRMLAHFCESAGIEWSGGAGIGTGEMISMMNGMPAKSPIRAPVVNAVKAIADAIAAGDGVKLRADIFAQHGIPWIMYKVAGEMGWRAQAKANCVKPKELSLRVMETNGGRA